MKTYEVHFLQIHRLNWNDRQEFWLPDAEILNLKEFKVKNTFLDKKQTKNYNGRIAIPHTDISIDTQIYIISILNETLNCSFSFRKWVSIIPPAYRIACPNFGHMAQFRNSIGLHLTQNFWMLQACHLK